MYNIFLIIIIDSELYMKLCTLVKEVNYGKVIEYGQCPNMETLGIS